MVGSTATGVGVAAVLVGTSLTQSATAPPVGSATVQSVALGVSSPSGDATVMTLAKGRPVDPLAAQDLLAAQGIRALVTVGKFCTTSAEPASVGKVVEKQAGGKLIIINPAAIPPHAKLSIGYFPNANGTVTVKFLLIEDHAPLKCSAGSQSAVRPLPSSRG